MVAVEKDEAHILLKPPGAAGNNPDVLSHTSGLAGSSELQKVTGSDSTPLSTSAELRYRPLQSQPGDKYAYGNQGMNIAPRRRDRERHALRGVSSEAVLRPAGMTETTFWPSASAGGASFAARYVQTKKERIRPRRFGFSDQAAKRRAHRYPERGRLFSTTHDIFRYGLMLANDGDLDGKRYLSHAAMTNCAKSRPERPR